MVHLPDLGSQLPYHMMTVIPDLCCTSMCPAEALSVLLKELNSLTVLHQLVVPQVALKVFHQVCSSAGKNDGSVKGVRYFRCRNRHGLFVRHDKLIMDKKRKGSSKMRNASSSSSLRRSTGNLVAAASGQKDISSSPSGSGGGSFMRATAASSAKNK